jgi:MerR family redox-sensitive transcriptional activator SoxR
MTIGEVAAQAGVRTSAIRYYEKLGLLTPPPRSGGKRIYQPEILHQLSVICFGKELGFSLEEIAVLLRDFPENAKASPYWNRLANAKIREMKDLIAKATTVKKMLEKTLQCRCAKLEDCAEGLTRARMRAALGQRS